MAIRAPDGANKVKPIFRKAESVFIQQEHLDIRDLSRETGCEKPCRYKKYRLIGDPQVFEIQDFSITDKMCKGQI